MVIRQLVRIAARSIRLAGLLLVLFTPGLSVAQIAAPPASSSPPASEAELRALIATLENDAERQRFLSQLKALLAAHAQGAEKQAGEDDAIDALSARLSHLSENL